MILSMETTMVTKAISELKSISRLKNLPKPGPWSQFLEQSYHKSTEGSSIIT